MESNSDHNVQSINQQILKSLSFKVNQFINLLKTYSPLIGGLPLFLGGLHQIICLMIIGPGYVRFFSVTQLLSDGLIWLIIIATYLFCLAIFYYIIFPFLEDRYKFKENDNKKYNDIYVITVYMGLMAGVIFLPINFMVNAIVKFLNGIIPILLLTIFQFL